MTEAFDGVLNFLADWDLDADALNCSWKQRLLIISILILLLLQSDDKENNNGAEEPMIQKDSKEVRSRDLRPSKFYPVHHIASWYFYIPCK